MMDDSPQPLFHTKIGTFQFFFLLITGALCTQPAAAGEVEVLHFWTSPGEAKSIVQLKDLIGVRGHTWKDFAVVGGGGQNAMAALKQRVLAGNPPSSATIKGPAVQEWASLNTLANLDAMATFEHWDDVLPQVVQEHVKYKGHYVAVPVNIHRVNWLWSNSEVLRKSGVVAVPSTFDELLAAADKIKAAGFVPIAHGGQPWQDFVLFESIALGVGGVDFYKRAFIKLDTGALAGPEMRRTLEAFRRVKAYTDDKSRGRDWNATTDMVIQGRAAFQFMGDWAKGEFFAAGRQPGRDFSCSAAPGSAGAFSYVIDTFAMFQLRNWEAQKAQGYLAYVLLGNEFQEQFNTRKGSIPARMNVRLDNFDECARASRRDFDATTKSETLVPSVAVDMALPTATQSALRAVLSDFWNNDGLSVSEAMARLIQASVPKK
jgi:glucose/mannose transport system substrate-binding protein